MFFFSCLTRGGKEGENRSCVATYGTAVHHAHARVCFAGVRAHVVARAGGRNHAVLQEAT